MYRKPDTKLVMTLDVLFKMKVIADNNIPLHYTGGNHLH